MKKRILAAAMAAVMMGTALTGCGNKPAESGSSSAAANTDANEIVIGGLAPLTGSVSIYGTAVNNAVQLAIEQINQGDGVLGKKIKYISYDTKGDATEAVNAYNKLVQNDKIVALIGDVTSTPHAGGFIRSGKERNPDDLRYCYRRGCHRGGPECIPRLLY